MEGPVLEIVTYRKEHQPWFEKFNRDWIERHFRMEPIDFEVLQHPEEHVLDPGGSIFMATFGKELAGTVAVKKVTHSVFELTKMAVDEKFQGKKIGRALAERAIGWAKKNGAKKIVLYSNTKLPTAIALYRKLGFYEIPVDGPYQRSDIKMELDLNAPAGFESLIFRKARIDDLPEIIEIYNSTIPGRMVTADTAPVSVADRLPWFHKHHDTRPLWVIDNTAGKIIGWVSFQSFYGRPAYAATAEISIYMDVHKRGHGLGMKILEYGIAKCNEMGIKTLLGFIFEHNLPSLKLFRRAGFDQWALLPNIAVLDGVEKSLMIFGKRVNP